MPPLECAPPATVGLLWYQTSPGSLARSRTRSGINRGEDDLDGAPLPRGQVRRKGCGRRALRDTDPTLVDNLRRIVEPATQGDPVQPLTWVSKSLDKLATELAAIGHTINHETVRSE